MLNSFNTAAPPTAEAENFLSKERYTPVRRADGMLVVQGNFDISHRGFHELPDLSCVIVTGNFYCQDNFLASLKGAPREVQGGFWCYNNRLTSLEYTPRGITGQFICGQNQLTSLEHAPAEITGDFVCKQNPLTSLEHAPKKFFSLQADF